MLRDEDAVIAQRVAKQGGKVVWREFESMPHCFAMMLEWLPESRAHYEEMARFCKAVVEGESVESSAEFVLAKSLKRERRDLGALTELSDEQVVEFMRQGKERIEKKAAEGAEEVRPMP